MASAKLVTALDYVLEALLWAMLAWLPFAFGGVLPLSHMVLVGGTATMALVFGVRCVLAPTQLVGSWAYVPLALFLGVIAVQGAAGSSAALAGVAPENHRLWSELLGDAPLAEPARPPLTMNPAATATDFRLLLGLGILFVLVANVLRSRGALRRLLTAVAVIGAAAAVLAIVQTISGTDSILWLHKTPGGKATAGTFVHYGHFSQFANLTIGCGLGLLLLRLAERDQRNTYKVEDLVRDLGAPDRRLDVFLFAFVIVAVVAISLSRSRNGVLSMALAGALTALLLHHTRYLRGMGWSLGGLAALAFVVLVMVGFDPVYDRMATLEDGSLYDFRLAIATDALSAFAKFPWLGSGQGTFADVFPLFDTTTRPGRAEHAENQYVELLVETGAIGFSLILLFLLAILFPWVRRLRHHREGTDGALFGLMFGVAAVLIHALSDFGLRIPAVMTLVVVCLGAVVARTGRTLSAGPLARAIGPVLALGGALLLFAQMPAIEKERIAYERAEAAKDVGSLVPTAETFDELRQLHDRQRGLLAAAIEATPDRADYQVAYATAAWASVVAAERVDFVPAKTPLPPEQVARLQKAAKLIQQALLESRRLCPIRGDLWSLVGQIGVEWLDDPSAARWIERGYRFAPENPTVCGAWARQLLKQGNMEEATRMFARAIKLGSDAWQLLPALVVDFERPDVALAVARGNPLWLLTIVQRFRNDENHKPLVEEARKELTTLLRETTRAPDAPAWMLAGLGELEAEANNDAAAISLYRRYLALVPNSGIRLSLALLLKKGGDLEAARQETRRFLNYEPGHTGAKNLLRVLGQ